MQSLNNLSIQGGTEKATYAFSTSFLTNEGIVPNEEYGRKTFRLAGTIQASDKLKLATTFNFVRSDYQRIQQGSNTSGLLLGLYRTPISFDNANGFSPEDAVDSPSSYIFANGKQRNYRVVVVMITHFGLLITLLEMRLLIVFMVASLLTTISISGLMLL